MADDSNRKSYWRKITLVYDKKEFTVVLPGPVVQRLEEGDMELMAEIKKNMEETGTPLSAGSNICATVTEDPVTPGSPQSLSDPVSLDSPLLSSDPVTPGSSLSPSDLSGFPVAPMPTPNTSSLGESSTSDAVPKMWNKRDSKLLFEARQALDKEFSQARSHKPLWGKISEKLQKEGCRVTWKQCENKFKSLKREYRATVDHNSKSGSIQGESQQSSSDEQIVVPAKMKPKRKSSQVTEWLQSYEERNLLDLPKEVVIAIVSFLNRDSKFSFASTSSVECSTEEQKEWAVLLNNYAGKISFGHSIIESVRASLLWNPRSLYSVPNPSGQY